MLLCAGYKIRDRHSVSHDAECQKDDFKVCVTDHRKACSVQLLKVTKLHWLVLGFRITIMQLSKYYFRINSSVFCVVSWFSKQFLAFTAYQIIFIHSLSGHPELTWPSCQSSCGSPLHTPRSSEPLSCRPLSHLCAARSPSELSWTSRTAPWLYLRKAFCVYLLYSL